MLKTEWWKTRKTLNEYFNLLTLATPTLLFNAMRMIAPWKDDTSVNPAHLDLLYYTRSGEKYVSPFLYTYVPTPPATNQQLQYIGGILMSIYNQSWTHLWNSWYDLDYDPIENYNMVETVDIDRTDTTNRTVTDTNKLYGFNSTTAQPSGEQQTVETGNTFVVDEGRTTTRHGNIGVTTTQQMLQSERDLWVWHYFDRVFDDIDKILTMPIY